METTRFIWVNTRTRLPSNPYIYIIRVPFFLVFSFSKALVRRPPDEKGKGVLLGYVV